MNRIFSAFMLALFFVITSQIKWQPATTTSAIAQSGIQKDLLGPSPFGTGLQTSKRVQKKCLKIVSGRCIDCEVKIKK
jgi:hypothetical protein